MALHLYQCTLCGRVISLFDDELVDNMPPQDEDSCDAGGCAWEKVLGEANTAIYTKSYTSAHPQWDNLKKINTQIKDRDQELWKDTHDKMIHKHLRS
jgi:hypothetical protein